MNFKDGDKNNVQSLLAMLRTTQAPGVPSGPAGSPPGPRPLGRASSGSDPNVAKSAVPSSAAVNDLFHSLQKSTSTHSPASAAASSGFGSAFHGARHNLIEPFGPVGQSSRRPSAPLPYDPYIPTDPLPLPPEKQAIESNIAGVYGNSLATLTSRDHDHPSGGDRKGKKRAREDPGWGTMGFKEALPILAELLEDEGFVREIQKLKKDQDNLERRLWAKGEKVKAEHERHVKAERDIARIARKPMGPDKQAEWARKLKEDMNEFYLAQCLPAIDGLAERQKRKMEELGVPGLQGDTGDPKVKERIRRVVDTLQAGLED